MAIGLELNYVFIQIIHCTKQRISVYYYIINPRGTAQTNLDFYMYVTLWYFGCLLM